MTNNTWRAALGGACTGMANGLFGGGGGMIAVPYLQRVQGFPAQKAHANAIAAVLPATLVSSVIYLCFGLVPLSVLLPVALGVALGGYLGAKLLCRLPAKWVSAVFAVFMFAAGVRMLFL